MKSLLRAAFLASLAPVFACKSHADVVTTPSGLSYKEIKVGVGIAPQKGQTVTVHYIIQDILSKMTKSLIALWIVRNPLAFVLEKGK